MAIYCNPKINLLENEYSINEYIIESIDEINILFEGVDFDRIKNVIKEAVEKAIKWIIEQASRFINFIKSFDIKNSLLRKQFKLYVINNKRYLKFLEDNYHKIDYDKIKDYKFDLYLNLDRKFETGITQGFFDIMEREPLTRYRTFNFSSGTNAQEILSGKSIFGSQLSDDEIKKRIDELQSSYNIYIRRLYSSFINLSSTGYDKFILKTIEKKVEENNIDEAKSIIFEYISDPHDCITEKNIFEIIRKILLFTTSDDKITKLLTNNIIEKKNNSIKGLKDIEQRLNSIEKYKKENIDLLIKEELKFINKYFEIDLEMVNFYIQLIHKYQQSYIKITKFLVSLANSINSDKNESTIFDNVQLI